MKTQKKEKRRIEQNIFNLPRKYTVIKKNKYEGGWESDGKKYSIMGLYSLVKESKGIEFIMLEGINQDLIDYKKMREKKRANYEKALEDKQK